VIDIDDFFPLVQPNALSAPEPLLTRCIRSAAIKFCQRTRLWRDHDTILTDGTEPEAINVPPDARFMEIITCALDGRPLTATTDAKLGRERPNWRTDDVGSGGARWFICPDFGTVWAIPKSSGRITLEMAIKPKITALTLPDFLLEDYGDTIADGATAAVLLTPNEAFGNPTLGAALSQRFEATLSTLFNKGLGGQQRGATRTRGSYF
jgi:hypothetical protein